MVSIDGRVTETGRGLTIFDFDFKTLLILHYLYGHIEHCISPAPEPRQRFGKW
jgi:hypothetical protein